MCATRYPVWRFWPQRMLKIESSNFPMMTSSVRCFRHTIEGCRPQSLSTFKLFCVVIICCAVYISWHRFHACKCCRCYCYHHYHFYHCCSFLHRVQVSNLDKPEVVLYSPGLNLDQDTDWPDRRVVASFQRGAVIVYFQAGHDSNFCSSFNIVL